jgi:hypothetical protein
MRFLWLVLAALMIGISIIISNELFDFVSTVYRSPDNFFDRYFTKVFLSLLIAFFAFAAAFAINKFLKKGRSRRGRINR